MGQSAADLADAILAVIEEGGPHTLVRVVELCAEARCANRVPRGFRQLPG